MSATDRMEIMPLGSGREVGRSCVIVKYLGSTVMFDCGVHPGVEAQRERSALRAIGIVRSGRHRDALLMERAGVHNRLDFTICTQDDEKVRDHLRAPIVVQLND